MKYFDNIDILALYHSVHIVKKQKNWNEGLLAFDDIVIHAHKTKSVAKFLFKCAYWQFENSGIILLNNY